MTDPTEVEIAWAAGLFDGEGYVRRVDSRHRQMALQMTDKAIVERFRDAVGGGPIRGPEVRPGRQDMWRWDASSASAVTVCQTLMPYVSERNRLRFVALIDAYAADKQGTCEWCGVSFPRVHRDRRLCSQSCKAKSYRARRAARSGESPRVP